MPKKAAESALRKATQAWVVKTAETELKHLYRTVRVLRRKQGLSVAELSEKSGVTESLIRRIEGGAMPRVTFHKLCRLAFVLAGTITGLCAIADRGHTPPPPPGGWGRWPLPPGKTSRGER